MIYWVKKSWIRSFLVFIVLGTIFLFTAILIGQQEIGNFIFDDKQKRMDIIGGIFGTAVAFASSLVTIVLATIAIKYAENQEKKSLTAILENRIKEIRQINSDIISAAKELKFVAFNSIFNVLKLIQDSVENEEEIDEEKIIKELNRNKKPLNSFAKAIIKLESNPIVMKHYKCNFNVNKDFYKQYDYLKESNDNSTFCPNEIVELSVQMKNLYIDNLPHTYIWNHISKISKELFDNYDREERKWILFSIIFGYGLGSYVSKEGNVKLSGAITGLDILINLPSTNDFIKCSEELDHSVDKNDAKKIIMNITGAIEEGNNIIDLDSAMGDTLIKIREKLIENFETLLYFVNKDEITPNYNESTYNHDLNDILKIAKGIAIIHKSKFIEINHIFNALSFVNLSNFADNVFAQMMGEHYNRITKSIGGNEYMEIAQNNPDIPYDHNIKMFTAELQKHLNNEKICSIR